MKNENKNIITSHWLRSSLLLVLVYFGQAYSFYHLHHVHVDGLLEREISSHSIKFDVEHLSDQHHDGDHQHTYDKHIDWLFTRPQSQRTVTIDDHNIISSTSYILTDDNSSSYFDLEELRFLDEYHASSSIIRGPPLLG